MIREIMADSSEWKWSGRLYFVRIDLVTSAYDVTVFRQPGVSLYHGAERNERPTSHAIVQF